MGNYLISTFSGANSWPDLSDIFITYLDDMHIASIGLDAISDFGQVTI